MVTSELTTHDENYWDSVHYTVEKAAAIANLLAAGAKEKRGAPGYFNYLGP